MKRTLIILLCLGAAAAAFASGSSGGSGGSGSAANGTGANAMKAMPTALDVYNQGYAAWKQENWADAARYFQSAISMKSDYAEAYNMLGFCTRKLGDLPKAIGYYETALRLKPNFPEAREYFGEAYLESGNLAKAVQQYVWLQKRGDKNAPELLEKISDYVDATAKG